MTIKSIERRAGIAGQVSYTAHTDDDGVSSHVTFVGSVYGGPVVMILASGAQAFVTEPSRFGKFGTEWVRAFLTTTTEED